MSDLSDSRERRSSGGPRGQKRSSDRKDSTREDRSGKRGGFSRGRDARQGRSDRFDRHKGYNRSGRSSHDDRRRDSNQREQKNDDRREERESREVPERNPADLRVSNRSDRGRSPDIDHDITGKELDRPVERELTALDDNNREWVSKHLAMAARYLFDDPELAFDHAMAASRRGGRLGVVREAVGMTAYAAGKFSDALREFRTYRRITGDNSHIPEMVDSERALGRREKALETAAETDLSKIPVNSRVELAMVVAGIYEDLGETENAVAALEIPELNPRRGFSYSPRLFEAYAHALRNAGRFEESKKWEVLSTRAAKALGQVDDVDPQIVDLGDEDLADERPPRAKDVVSSSEPE